MRWIFQSQLLPRGASVWPKLLHLQLWLPTSKNGWGWQSGGRQNGGPGPGVSTWTRNRARLSRAQRSERSQESVADLLHHTCPAVWQPHGILDSSVGVWSCGPRLCDMAGGHFPGSWGCAVQPGRISSKGHRRESCWHSATCGARGHTWMERVVFPWSHLVDRICRRNCGSSISLKGFLTAEAPLLVSQSEHSTAVHPALTSPWTPAADSKGLRPFSLGNVKGFARASTLQMLLFRAMDLGIDLKTLMPDFWSSVRKVYVHCMPITNRLDEAMQNMKLSARGSLRQANNTIQCVVMIQNLCARGGLTDASHFIRRWNAMAAKSFQIVGRKQMALKQLFENTPQESMTCMLFLWFHPKRSSLNCSYDDWWWFWFFRAAVSRKCSPASLHMWESSAGQIACGATRTWQRRSCTPTFSSQLRARSGRTDSGQQ